MDQVKIGKFIATCRKEKNYTQAALAEQLGITDRAISKWENGKSLPDSSIMLELCELLSINVNELLKGERIMVDEYSKVDAELMVQFKRQDEEKSRMLLRMEIMLGVMVMVVFAALSVIGIYISENEPVMGQLILGVATLMIVTFALIGVWIEQQAGYYECLACGHRYRPSYVKALMAPHMGRARKMKCPECGQKNYHKKVISTEK